MGERWDWMGCSMASIAAPLPLSEASDLRASNQEDPDLLPLSPHPLQLTKTAALSLAVLSSCDLQARGSVTEGTPETTLEEDSVVLSQSSLLHISMDTKRGG